MPGSFSSRWRKIGSRRGPLHIGYVPLNDAAPILMAHELGLFEKYGLEVELSREVGWATIRDKILYGELDAAHAVAGLVLAASCGIGSHPARMSHRAGAESARQRDHALE